MKMENISIDRIIVEADAGCRIVEAYKEALVLAITEDRTVEITLNERVYILTPNKITAYLMEATLSGAAT